MIQITFTSKGCMDQHLSDLKSVFIGLTIVLSVSSAEAMAQGCSDAGFCTLGNLHQQRSDSADSKQKLTFLMAVGIGDESVFVITPAIQYDRQFSVRWGIQAKVTGNYASGNLGRASGAGDLYLSATHTFPSRAMWKTSITLGTKLPLNLSDLKEHGRALPMQYQSSLGTIDAIAGLSLSNNVWQFAAGWQQPLSGINRNNFLPAYWDNPRAEAYPPTNDFDRKGDVLLRAAYHFNTKSNFSVSTGLLAIYHIDEDTYIDANESIRPIPIRGSQGLTLNATVVALWKINSMSIGLSAGAPLVFRDIRPDGLTRKFVMIPEIHWNF
jgi:hypothetical protein